MQIAYPGDNVQLKCFSYGIPTWTRQNVTLIYNDILELLNVTRKNTGVYTCDGFDFLSNKFRVRSGLLVAPR